MIELLKGSLVVLSKKYEITKSGKYKVKINLMVKTGVANSFDFSLFVKPSPAYLTPATQKHLNPSTSAGFDYIESEEFFATEHTSIFFYLVSHNPELKTGLIIKDVIISGPK